MCAGYTIHTVVALVHAGLVPLEQQEAVQQGFQQCAPLLNTTPSALIALVDKSLPTMIGLGGDTLFACALHNSFMPFHIFPFFLEAPFLHAAVLTWAFCNLFS